MSAGVIALAVMALAGPWRAAVWAELGLSSAIDVEIEFPDEIDATVYTPDADVPAWLPIGVLSEVGPGDLRGGAVVDDITSVVTALGGELNADTGEITDELEEMEATLINVSEDENEYVAVLDLANMDFETITRGSPARFAEDVIRTVAIAEGYYNGSRTITDIVEGDAINVAVQILDSADIDGDGNGFPDASALLDLLEAIIYGTNGSVTIVRSLGDAVVRGETEVIVDHYYESQFGPVLVSVESPTLEALQLADDAFDAFNTARLIISISEDASGLIDTPSGFDPVSEFDLVDSNDDPLPAPENLFVRAVIAVTNVSRGAVTDWTFVGEEGFEMPGSLEFIGELSGPGIAEALESGTDVGAYTYSLTMAQDNDDITAEATEDSAWAEVDDITLNNEDNADDDADSRDTVDADDGDDTVRVIFSTGAALFGSNVTPRVGGGGGGGGGSGCFIATAAYGTPMAREIQSLRDVRDAYLIDTMIGAAFVDAYYRISPPIARMVSENAAAKTAVRAVLAPVVAVSGWSMAAPGAVAAGALLIVLAIGVGVRRIRRA